MHHISSTDSSAGDIYPRTILLLFAASLLAFQACNINSGTRQYRVNVEVSPSGSGTVSPSADSTYNAGDPVTLSARADTGYAFSKWEGDVDTAGNPLTLTLNRDYSLTALFVKQNYPLVVNTEGGGQVHQQVLEADTSRYDHGTQVYLEAEADDDYNFDSWKGDVDSTRGNKAWVTVTGPREVTAVFVKRTFSLTVNTSGSGSVAADPDSAEYVVGTGVELTASADAGWSFSEWTGDTAGTANPFTVTVDSNMSVTAVFANDDFAGGNGTEARPYRISTPEQLQKVNSYTDSHFILVNDIDATATSTWNNGNGFRPLGDDVVRFTGSFDGQGHEITGLYIDRGAQSEIGLFGYVEGGSIKNLVLTALNITGGEFTGGLAGVMDGGTVDSVSSAGTVNGGDNTGGLVGENRGTLRRTYATATVTGTGTNAGGLAGTHTATGLIELSYATGDVTGDEKAGGLVGESAQQAEIRNSYARGAVDGNDTVGGLAGAVNTDSSVSLSYATGAVTGSFDVGGFAGANAGTLDTCYWDTQNSGQSGGVGIGNDSGTTGLTTDEMSGTSAETEMGGLDFDSVWTSVSGEYPILSWQQSP